MPFFDQELFIRAEAKGGLDSKEYLEALANNHKYSRAEGIDKVMGENRLDALFALTGGPAWATDYVNAHHFCDSFTTPAAVAGHPHTRGPAAFIAGLPTGRCFGAGAWAEGALF